MNPFRSLSVAALVLSACAISVPAQSRPLPRRPNIVLIVADGLGIGDLSCYGQSQFQTPHMDELAAMGARFTQYTAGGAASAPARAALMLGRDTSYLSDSGFELTSRDTSVAEILRNSGYNTCLVGEWDLGDENSQGAPWQQGFNNFCGYFNPAVWRNVYPTYVWRYFARFNLQKKESDVFNGREPVYSNLNGQKQQYEPDALMKFTVNFAKNHAPDRFNHYRPLFIMVNETIPGNGDREVPTDAPFSEEPWPQPEKNRAATIARLDDDIGQLMDQFNAMGQGSNTVFFLTSDTVPRKGGGVDPKFFHENAGPDDLRVPFIVYWHGAIRPGVVSNVKCSARDFLPTATDIALYQPARKVEGKSLLPAMVGSRQK